MCCVFSSFIEVFSGVYFCLILFCGGLSFFCVLREGGEEDE